MSSALLGNFNIYEVSGYKSFTFTFLSGYKSFLSEDLSISLCDLTFTFLLLQDMEANCWKRNSFQNVYFSEVLARDLVSNQRGCDGTYRAGDREVEGRGRI